MKLNPLSIRYALLVAGGCLHGQLGAGEIPAHPSDGRFYTNTSGAIQNVTPVSVTNISVFVGRAYYSNSLDHYVVPFQLPDLGDGEFSDVSVTFRTRVAGEPPVAIDVNLFAIPGARPFSSTLPTDVSGSGQNHTQRGTLIKASFLNPSLENPSSVSTGPDEQATLATWLNAAYQEGIQGGNFVFMRLSPAGLTPDSVGGYSDAESGYGYNIVTGGNNSFGAGASLNYTFTPAAANTPQIVSFTASPAAVATGGSSTLNWSVTQAETLTLDPGAIDVTGLAEYNVSPTATTTYTLRAASAAGTRQRSVTVTVQPSVSAISLRGTANTATVGGSTSSITVNKPDGVIAGDLMIAAITKNAAGGLVDTTPPTGWTAIDQRALFTATNSGHAAVFYRIASSDDAAVPSYAFTLKGSNLGTNSANGASAIITAFGGIDSSNPFDVATGTIRINATTSNTLTADGITTVSPSTAVLMIGHTGGNSTNHSNFQTATSPGALTSLGVARRQGSSAAMAWAIKSDAGATGDGTATLSNTVVSGGLLLALRESAKPIVNSFSATPAEFSPGEPVTLSWSVSKASQIEIVGVGTVPPSGSLVVNPSATTTYTLNATNASGTTSVPVVATLDVFQPGPYRYYRLVPLMTRAPLGSTTSTLYYMNLSDFHFTKDGVRVAAVSVTAPGSTSPANAPRLNDGDINTRYSDSPPTNVLPRPIFYDMGTNSANWNVNGCRIGTDPFSSPDYDLRSWRIDGSHNNTKWYPVDVQTDFQSPLARGVFTEVIPFNFAPTVTFTAEPSDIVEGGSATLRWNVGGADSISIDQGIGAIVEFFDSIEVSPGLGSTTYTLTASNGSYGTRTASVTVISGAQSTPVAIANHSFEDDPNTDPDGAFAASAMNLLSGWSMVALDNSAYPENQEVLTGRQNLVPAAGNQALCLLSGAVVAQETALNWSDLNPGDQVKITVAMGDRATHPDANPRWADESFVAVTDGLATRVGNTPGVQGWLGNVVGTSSSVVTPPGGYKSGTMGDTSWTYNVKDGDYLRTGKVGIALASLGYRDGVENGADAPGAQSFWDNVRLEVIRAPGPLIRSFAATATNINAGSEIVLSWEVDNVDAVTISPFPGTFPATGSIELVPSLSTTYTLNAANSLASQSRELRVSVNGPVVARYFRFTPLEVRGPYVTATSAGVEISEFEILNGETPLTGATAGSTIRVKVGNEPALALDGNFNTSWWNFYLEPLTLDYGAGVLATGYRFRTNNSVSNRDLVSWRLEGSVDGTSWFVLDERKGQDVTTARMETVGSFNTQFNTAYPDAEGLPVVESFTASPNAITEGDSITLSWSVSGAETVELVGVGLVDAAGSLEVSPRESGNYYLLSRNAAGFSFESVRVAVQRLTRGTIIAGYDDASYETDMSDGSVVFGPLGEMFELLDVGRLPGQSVTNHMVIPFQLPDLGSGAFVEGELKVFVEPGELGLAGRIPIQLYVVPGTRDDSLTFDADVAELGKTPLDSGILVKSGFLNTGTAFNTIVSSGEQGLAAEGLGYWLNEAYANGANAGRYVFIRLSPDALEVPEGAGFGIRSADDQQGRGPTLSYVFNPVGTTAGPPVVSTFNTNTSVLIEGSSTRLDWSVLGADTVEVDGVLVSASGSLVISPTSTTTYTLSASNAVGSKSQTFTQVVVPQGTWRYLRFTAKKSRVVPNVSIIGNAGVSLTEFQIFDRNGPIAATDAGVSDFNAFGGASVLVNGLFDRSWTGRSVDSGFVIDYRRFVSPFGYRFATNLYVLDPVSWTIEGSVDGNQWLLVDQRIDADASVPEVPGFSDPFYFEAVPEILSFGSDASIITPGGTANLSWNVANAESVSIDFGVGTVDAAGSVAVNPSQNTVYTLTATGNGVTKTRWVRVSVDDGRGLLGYVYDDLAYSSFYNLIQPVSNLDQEVVAGTFVQSADLSYPDYTLYRRQPTDLPGLTSPNSLAVVWKGWFDVTLDGPGVYTFGTGSSGGSTIYLDLNNDGDFDDAGEFVLNNNLVDGYLIEGKRATVNLQMRSVRMAIGYWENSSGARAMVARFAKGNLPYESLQPINGTSGHFRTSEPQAPYIYASISEKRIAKGLPVTLTWSVEEADTVSVDNGIGEVAASGSLDLYPQQTTTYTITANGSGNTNTRSLTVVVTNGGLLARSYDTAKGENLLFPITNLIAQTPTVSFMQSEPVDYPTPQSWVDTLPGITYWENFSALWQGVFRTSVDGIGEYSFGLSSGTGCVIYIDLNGDGDFDDPGEDVVKRRGFSWGGSTTATVSLNNPNGHRIAIAFTDDDQGGPKNFSARFKKGASVPFESMDIVSGETAHFVPTLVTPPVGPPPTPVITVTGNPFIIYSNYRDESTVEEVEVSGVFLTGSLQITAPTGFQVSTSSSGGFAGSLAVNPVEGAVTRTIYIRMDSSQPTTFYTGEISFASDGAESRTQAISGWVFARDITVLANDMSKIYGDPDPVFTFNVVGLADDDQLTGELNRDSGEDVGTYPINQGSIDGGSNYSISYTGATFTILPKSVTVNLTRNGNAFTADADGVTAFTYSYSGRNETSYGPSADAPSADGDYTVTATVADANYTGTASEYFSIGSDPAHPAFSVKSITMAGSVCTMVWDSQPGAIYVVEATGDLADPQSWTSLAAAVASQGATTTFSIDLSNTTHAGAAKLFMRVRVQGAD